MKAFRMAQTISLTAVAVVLVLAGVGIADEQVPELRITTAQRNFLPGEALTFSVSVPATAGEADLRVNLYQDGWRQSLVRMRVQGPAELTRTVQVGWLRSGDYVLRARLQTTDGATAAAATIGIYPNPYRNSFFTFLYAVECGATGDNDEPFVPVLSDLKSHGVDCGFYVSCSSEQPRFYNHARKYGISFTGFCSTVYNDSDYPPGTPKAQIRRECIQGSDGVLQSYWGHPLRCFNRPDQHAYGRELMRTRVPQYMLDPGGARAVVLDDEIGLNYISTFTIGCYCPYCRYDFRRKYGCSPPKEDYALQFEPGLVEDDNLWLQWYRYRCRVIPDYYGDIARVLRRRSRPGLVITAQQNTGSCPYSGADLENYTDWQDVINIHAYPDVHPLTMTSFSYDLWNMANVLVEPAHRKPIWLMGQAFAGREGVQPTTYIKEQLHLATASGAKAVGLFLYNLLPEWALTAHPQRWRQVGDLFLQIRALGPLWTAAERIPRPVALMSSFTTDAFMNARGLEEGQWYQWHLGEQAHAALMAAHIPSEIIGEQAIRIGKASQYQAVILMGCRYLPRSVAVALHEYMDAGGVVYADEGTQVPLEGLRRLPFGFSDWREVVRREWEGKGERDRRLVYEIINQQAAYLSKELAWVKPWYRIDDPDAVARGLEVPGARVLYVVNNALQWQDKTSPEKDILQATIRPTITLSESGLYVYDLWEHRAVPVRYSEGTTSWQCELPGGGGTPYLITRQALDRPRLVLAPDRLPAGQTLRYTVQVRNVAGESVAVSVPLSVEVVDPNGNRADGSGPQVALGGTLSVNLRIADNAMPGRWRIVVTDLASGADTSAAFEVF